MDARALRRPAVTATALGALLLTARAAEARPHGYAERRYTTADGLSQTQVTAIAQDAHGYLWLTTGNGLDRFDGVSFTRFGEEEGLPCVYDDYVIADDRGVVAACSGAVAVEDGTRFRPLALPAGTSSGSAYALARDGDVLYAAIGTSIVRLPDHGEATLVELPDVARGSPTDAIVRTAEGVVLAGGKYGVVQLEPGGRRATAPTGRFAALAPVHMLFAYAFRDGRVWAGNADGLFVLEGDRVARVGAEEGLVNPRWMASSGENENELWVASSKGVWRVDGARVEQVAAAHDEVRTLFVDREGDVWFATTDALHELTPAKFDVLSSDDGLPSDHVTAVLHASDGSTWLGTAKGVARVRGDDVRAFGVESGLTTVNVVSLYEDRSARVWVGTSSGLFRFDGARFVVASELADRWIAAAAPQGDGTVWLAGGQGLARVDANAHVLETRLDGLVDPDVFSIFRDGARALWITYTHATGASQLLADGTLRHYTAPPPGRPPGFGASVFVDSKQRVWMPSDHGVVRLDVDPPRAFGVHEGMPDDNAYSVLEDSAGDLWVSTDGGLACFDGEKVLARYTVADGLAANEGNSGAAAKDPSGRLWFGTTGGVSVVDPAHIPKNERAPEVLVESVRYGERVVPPDAVPAEIAWTENNVRFDFTAASLRAPRSVRFEYQLEGFDRGWTRLDPPVLQRRAAYTNLPAGEYAFRVRAANEDGVGSPVPAVVRFRVLPPWWRTIWAYAAYAVALVGVGSLGTLSRTRALRRRAVLLEAKVHERTAELDAKVAELSRVNAELVASHERAGRIFSALAEALPGTVLDGKYRLDERIGNGGFGAVFRATHLEMRRAVAVKVFRPTEGNDSPEALERFRREAIAASRVRHPNAVSVHDSGISKEGIAYLVMELLDGPSLAEALDKEGPFSLARALGVAVPVCEALQAAHDAGIVHRDMKPANVVLHRAEDGHEVVKVVDFGIARLVGGRDLTEALELTRSHVVVGTPPYIAPERLRGQAYDGRADVYSVGVMVYEMLSGALPHDPARGGTGPAEGASSYAELVVATPPRPLRDRVARIPPEVDALVMRALDPSPSRRPSPAELGRALADALARAPEEVLARRLEPRAPQPLPVTARTTNAAK